jgi:hypothetical protein
MRFRRFISGVFVPPHILDLIFNETNRNQMGTKRVRIKVILFLCKNQVFLVNLLGYVRKGLVN